MSLLAAAPVDDLEADRETLPVPNVSAVPDAVRQALNLSPFYQKYADAGGIPVVSSDKPSDYALLEAAYLINQVLAHRPDVRQAMIRNKARVGVMAFSELTTDIPEHAHMRPKEYADKRARGMGGPQCVSCAEENLLGYPGDPYAAENILIHEFAHGVHQMGLRSADPTFNRRLREAFDQAVQAGLWQGKYAASNPGEYWAEGVQSWFDTNRENDSSHNHVNTREELKAYDPALAKLVEEVCGDGSWRYQRPAERAEPEHLTGFDRSRAPRFSWPAHLLEWNRLHAREVEQGRGRGRRADLPLAPVAEAALPASRVGGAETSILFVNRREHAVALHWIDAQGQREPRGRIEAGGRLEQKTFAGHVWLVTGPGDKPLATVVAAERPGRAVIAAAAAERAREF